MNCTRDPALYNRVTLLALVALLCFGQWVYTAENSAEVSEEGSLNAKSFKNIDFLGRGYDLYFGFPMEKAVGGDPGYRHQVFSMKSENHTLSPDWRHLYPTDVDVVERVTCESDVSQDVVSTSEELQEEASKSSEESHSATFAVEVEFSGMTAGVETEAGHTSSESSKEMQRNLNSGETIYIVSHAECSVFEAKLSSYKLPPFDESFKRSVDSLSNSYSDSSADRYRTFIQVYGTHVIQGALFGSRYGKVYEMEKSQIETEEETQKSEGSSTFFSATASVGAELGPVEAEVSVGGGYSTEKVANSSNWAEEKLSQKASDETIFSIGAPYNPDIKEWAKKSATDPMPIKIDLLPIVFVVAQIDAQKAMSLQSALIDYAPKKGSSGRLNLGYCYEARFDNLLYQSYSRQKSLIAQCQPGYEAMGGTFMHLYNTHEDVHIDALASTTHQLMDDITLFNAIRSEMIQLDFLLQHGEDMLKEFVDADTMDNLASIFGDRVNPSKVKQFLVGGLRSLGVEKENALKGISSGLKTMGISSLGSMAADYSKKNPYMKSIFNVGKSLVKTLPRIQTLSADGNSELNSNLEHHVQVLAEIFNTLNARNGRHVFSPEESKPQIFGLIKSIADKIKDTFKSLTEEIKKQVTPALAHWKKFAANVDDIWINSVDELKKQQSSIHSTSLYQNVLADVNSHQDNIHYTTLLADRNALNFMFPFGKGAYICGSGMRGMTPTTDGRSNMGSCRVYCCRSRTWQFEVKKEKEKKTSMKKRVSESIASCTSGYTVISGGVVLTDYQEGRFVQITKSRPEGTNGWKCGIKWSEEDTYPFSPKFECIAKCAKAPIKPIQCRNVEAALVNGDATATCENNEMALAGGWDIQSKGITYYKETSMPDIHRYDGSRQFKCSFGSSHGDIQGKCIARCCHTEAAGVERGVSDEEQQKCDSILHHFRVRTPRFFGAWHIGYHSNYRLPKDLGSRLYIGESMNRYDAMTSRNGKYLLRYTYRFFYSRFEVWRKADCEYSSFLDSMWFHAENYCNYKMRSMASVHITENGLELRYGQKTCGTIEIWKGKVKYMHLADNGNVVFYNEDDEALKEYEMSRCQPYHEQVHNQGEVLKNGEFLTLESGIFSKNKYYGFVLLPGGAPALIYHHPNFHCREPVVVWTTAEVHGKSVRHLKDLNEFNREEKEGWMMRLQENNNLVLYDDNGKVMFSSDTADAGVGKASLMLDDKGGIALYDAVGTELWNPFTKKTKSCDRLMDKLKITSHRLPIGKKLKPGEGGLASRNGEYVLYIRLDEKTGSSNLELWANGGDDCAPLRMCVVKTGLKELSITEDAVVGNHGEKLFSFKKGSPPINQLVLDKNGHLTVYAGKHNRREISESLSFECGGIQ